jgi:dynein heavy chain
MNSVLDDSKLLCLDSGERIKLNNTIHMIFEAQDLSVASPATVSRLGMIYMDPGDLGWQSSFKSYCSLDFERGGLPEACTESALELIESLFSSHVDPALQFVNKECAFTVPAEDGMLVRSLMDLFRSLLVNGGAKEKGVDWKSDELPELLHLVFFFSLIWTIGGNLNTASQKKFDAYFREAFKDIPEAQVMALNQDASVIEHYVDFEEKNLEALSGCCASI